MEKIENNVVNISGEIVSDFLYDHESYGEGFYTTHIAVERLSGAVDRIPIMVSERLLDMNQNYVGQKVSVSGQFRSFNKGENEKRLLVLNVFVQDFGVVSDATNDNRIFLEGYLCKEPVYRETTLGRKIADLLIAANRSYGKSDYIPCVCWGRNARFAGNLEVGTRVKVSGRIQSRQYVKTLPDGSTEERTAYEVSVSKMEVVEDED